jgi:predicted nucleic-acid-binding protein
MIGLDTNVLVRFITLDDETQSGTAKELILKYSGISKALFVNNIVLCELLWVLKKGYKYSKKQLLEVLEVLLTTKEIAFENRNLVSQASLAYKNGKADFSNYLTFAINEKRKCKCTYSFDDTTIKKKLFTQADIS